MNELNTIRQVLAKTARRRRLAHGLAGLWKGLLAGAILLLVTFSIYKFAPIPEGALIGVGGAALLAAVFGFVWGWMRPVSLMDTARWVDNQKRFQERLSTALEMAESKLDERWKNLVVSDAAARLKEVDAKQLLPISLTKASRWALALLLVTATLGFVPEYRTKAYVQKKKDAEVIKETGKQLVELTKRTLEQKPPMMEPARKALEDVNALGDHFAKAQLTRSEALKDLASAMQKLKDDTKEIRQSQAFKALDKAAKASSKGGTQSSSDLAKQMEALQQQMQAQNANPDALDKFKKDLDKAQEAAANLQKMEPGKAREEAEKKLQAQLADMAKESKEMGMNMEDLDKAIAALRESDADQVVKDLEMAEIDLERMRDRAKTLEKLQMQMDKLGKDLAEQLKNGQVEAAQSTISKMQQELEKASLSQEQMGEMMKQVAAAQKPGDEYGKAGEMLKEAGKKMAAGDKKGASEALGEASKELGKMTSEMGDAQSILQSLEALQQAQMAIGNGQGWANMPSKKRGNGKGGQGDEGEKSSGGGFGTWHDENSWQYPEFKDKWDNNGQASRQDMDGRSTKDKDGTLSDNLVATKVKGQMTPGGPMPSITMKGVSIKGNSKVQIQEMVGAAQSDAQGALSQDQVPRAYQGAVKDYFNDLKE